MTTKPKPFERRIKLNGMNIMEVDDGYELLKQGLPIGKSFQSGPAGVTGPWISYAEAKARAALWAHADELLKACNALVFSNDLRTAIDIARRTIEAIEKESKI